MLIKNKVEIQKNSVLVCAVITLLASAIVSFISLKYVKLYHYKIIIADYLGEVTTGSQNGSSTGH